VVLTIRVINNDILCEQDMYDGMDMRLRRSSSPGYIDSPTYSRQGMSPIMPRSPQHYYRYGEFLLPSSQQYIKYTLDF